MAARGKMEADRGPVPAIGIFADDQTVADEQIRHHRFGRDVERLRHEAVKGEHGQQHEEEAAQFREPVDVVFAGLGCLGSAFGHGGGATHAGKASMITKAWAHG